jgi:hypothetical protein
LFVVKWRCILLWLLLIPIISRFSITRVSLQNTFISIFSFEKNKKNFWNNGNVLTLLLSRFFWAFFKNVFLNIVRIHDWQLKSYEINVVLTLSRKHSSCTTTQDFRYHPWVNNTSSSSSSPFELALMFLLLGEWRENKTA